MNRMTRPSDEESFWESTLNFTETALPANVLTKLMEANDGIVGETIAVPSGYT